MTAALMCIVLDGFNLSCFVLTVITSGIFFLTCCTLQHFRGLSFPTISSVGPNAAIIHYAPDPKTCSEFDVDQIYLFDSGAQVCPLIF